ncbi:MAG: DUF2079 domain-containing protein [Acidimicrobiia bacterium]|nr:DUF2079 domain-containing protein [Acidimicrobiia bacterium]
MTASGSVAEAGSPLDGRPLPWRRAKSGLLRWLVAATRWSLSARVVGLATATFVVVYGTLILQKHARFGTQAFDLGIFDQGLWLLSRFKTPFVTLRGLHLFGDHSSYILILLAPLYWMWADVRVLLMLTVVALASSGPLVYMIARTEGVRKPLAAALAVAFLLHPAIGWNVWNVFHPEVLAVPLLLAAYLFTARGRPVWGAVVLGLTLLIKEDAALIVAPLALYLAWRFREWQIHGVVVLVAVAVFAFNFLVALPHFSPTGELIYTNRYSTFGDTLPSIIGGVLTSPGQVFSLLSATDRLVYTAAMVGPMALALLAPELLVVGLPIALVNLLSQHGYQGNIRYQYTSYLLAIVALAAIRGAARLTSVSKDKPTRPVLAAVLVGAVVIAGGLGTFLAGPLPRNDPGNPWAGYSSQPGEVRRALDLIPGDAVVSADWFISPHLTHRDTIYMYPNPFVRDAWGVASEPPPPSADTVEWVVVRTDTLDNNGTDKSGRTARAFELIQTDPQFEEVVANEWVVVFRRVREP